MHSSPASLDGGRPRFMRRDRFEVNQYVRVQVSESRFAIGAVTAIDEDHDKATVETRNGYEVTVPTSALHRAFLVVLDLNGVLVARGRGSFILRPHVLEFLKFVFSNFVVAVWTSGLQRSSNPIIEHVFGSYRDLLLFTLFRDACVSKATAENPYGTEKNLQTIFDRYPLSFHAVNTIIIDDSPDKCSHPDIALCPIPFKDPVAQSQDDGLLETMATLREVLRIDSGAPLILAAEARLHRLAEEQQQSPQLDSVASPSQGTTPSSVAPAACASPATAELPRGADEDDVPADMEEVELWKTRLCCENLLGKCARGEQCVFSHDPDDGRPCSRKSNCRYHGSRWPKTSEEAESEARKRQLREAKQQQYKLELEKRQLERHSAPVSRGQSRRHSDALHQPQQVAAPRQRGGRSRQQQQQQRGGRHSDPWTLEEGEEEDWASGPTGLSHTGDPAYDNMINEQQQQQQQRRGAGPAGRSTQVRTEERHLGRDERASASSLSAPGAFNASYGNYTTTNATTSTHNISSHNLSSGYRRQLQHHSESSSNSASNGAGRRDAYPQSFVQQLSQMHAPSRHTTESSVPFFFQSSTAASPVATTAVPVIEPFSTRPIAQPTVSAQPTVMPISVSQPPQHQQHPSMSLSTASTQGRNLGTSRPQRGPQAHSLPQQYQHQQQQQQSQYHPTSLPQQQQHQQTIRISGSQGDSSAVVSQLQALLRNS